MDTTIYIVRLPFTAWITRTIITHTNLLTTCNRLTTTLLFTIFWTSFAALVILLPFFKQDCVVVVLVVFFVWCISVMFSAIFLLRYLEIVVGWGEVGGLVLAVVGCTTLPSLAASRTMKLQRSIALSPCVAWFPSIRVVMEFYFRFWNLGFGSVDLEICMQVCIFENSCCIWKFQLCPSKLTCVRHIRRNAIVC